MQIGTLNGGSGCRRPCRRSTRRAYRLFSLVWMLAFLLAFVGPLAGFYDRYTAPENNSQLLLGSRAGFAVSPRDATMRALHGRSAGRERRDPRRRPDRRDLRAALPPRHAGQ